ncbi:O-antigen ligase family protein [Streptomyces sp. NPDC008150]|uniref:O-antigen ligase family protein n=1 Tax=Streptomyces sp. NPDC008150 TaxID=3364816 RepID=UPI0036EA8F8A
MRSTGLVPADGVSAGGDRRDVSDVVGVLVLGGCAVWSLVTAALRDGRPEGVLLAVLAVSAGYAAGRIGGALLPVAVPAACALAGPVVTLAAPGLDPGRGFAVPLGHLGATAALLTLSAGAACCAAWATPVPGVRTALRLLAAGIAVAAGVAGSVTGCVCCAAVLVCSLGAGRVRRGPGVAALTLLTALAAGAAWAVAADVLPEGLTESAAGGLSSRRVGLWHDAWRLARSHWLLGVGPGRFGQSGTAVAAADGTPHSAPLQMAAEQGLAGVALLAAAFCWLLYALWRTDRPAPQALTAGVALSLLAVVASVGNALSFTAVTAGAGVLAGLATAHPLAEEAESGARPPRDGPAE